MTVESSRYYNVTRKSYFCMAMKVEREYVNFYIGCTCTSGEDSGTNDTCDNGK